MTKVCGILPLQLTIAGRFNLENMLAMTPPEQHAFVKQCVDIGNERQHGFTVARLPRRARVEAHALTVGLFACRHGRRIVRPRVPQPDVRAGQEPRREYESIT